MQQIVKALSKAIGLANTLELCSRWGGREVSVPREITSRLHPIALTIGLEPAITLAKKFGGQSLRLPMERNALLDLRNRMIAQELEDGASLTRVGNRYGLSRDSIKIIYERMKARGEVGLAGIHLGEDPRQLSNHHDSEVSEWHPVD